MNKKPNYSNIKNINHFREKQRARRKKIIKIKITIFMLFCIILISFIINHKKNGSDGNTSTDFDTIEDDELTDTVFYGSSGLNNNDDYNSISDYAALHNYDISEYPDILFELFEKNPEARQFVLEYPEKKNISYDIDLSEYSNCNTVPLLMQWDERWGYTEYSGNLFGLSGCGPTCLSMAAIYLLGDTSMNPLWMADFSREHGYSIEGSGSAWTLISEGAQYLGMSVRELSLSETIMADELNQGHIIICIMGPGDFTDSGHFIVLTGYTEEGFTINDPNSVIKSEKIWSYDELSWQIRCLWALSR